MTPNHPEEQQRNGSVGEWRCAACSGEWTIGVLLLGGRFHPTCDPFPSATTDAVEIWDG